MFASIYIYNNNNNNNKASLSKFFTNKEKKFACRNTKQFFTFETSFYTTY